MLVITGRQVPIADDDDICTSDDGLRSEQSVRVERYRRPPSGLSISALTAPRGL